MSSPVELLEPVGPNPAVEELQEISVFSDLPREALTWLASQMSAFEVQSGDILVRAGDPADHLIVLFRGEIHAERGDGRVYVMHTGQVTGLLPYSRLTHYPSTARAIMDSRGARLHQSHFAE